MCRSLSFLLQGAILTAVKDSLRYSWGWSRLVQGPSLKALRHMY